MCYILFYYINIFAIIDLCFINYVYKIIKPGKKGYAIVLRTSPNMKECERLIETIEHFYGHLKIECAGHIGFTGVEYKENVGAHRKEIEEFCAKIEAVGGVNINVTI